MIVFVPLFSLFSCISPYGSGDKDSAAEASNPSGSEGTSVVGDVWDGADCGEFDYQQQDNEGECYTQSVSCGDVVALSTAGGTSYYDAAQYLQWQEHSTGDPEYTGPERAFFFTAPDGPSNTIVTLGSPCENMELFYFKAYSVGDCRSGECAPCAQDNDSSKNPGKQFDEVEIYDTSGSTYLIIVESKNGNASPFELSLRCD